MCLCIHFNEQHQSLFLKVTDLGLSQNVTVAVLCAIKKGEESTVIIQFPSPKSNLPFTMIIYHGFVIVSREVRGLGACPFFKVT